ncbi:hypothetical protein PQR33_36075 [Paraburkholderia sediminicola]|uniref:hypothetical protein n=1 Tax=Paraburkholderia sediminicola TaxID=458836 RepID=UPI0038B9A143
MHPCKITFTLMGSFFLYFSGSTSSYGADETFTSYPTQGGVSLTTGWNSFRGEKTQAVCVDAGIINAPGQYRDVSYTQVTDTSSLMTALSVSAEAKVGAIQGASGNISASFSRSSNVNFSSLVIAVSVLIVQKAQYTVPPALASSLQQFNNSVAQPANAIRQPVVSTTTAGGSNGASIRLQDWAVQLAASDPINFQKTCGDSFVSTVRSGTGIQGTYSIATHSDAEKQSLAVSMGGSYGPFSGSASATNEISSLETESRVNIKYIQLGGDGTAIATDDKSFQTLIQGLGTAGNGASFEIGLTKYSALENFPSPQPGTSDLLEMSNQYFRLDDLDRQIDNILLNSQSGPDAVLYDHKLTPATVGNTQDQIKQDKIALKSALLACASNAATCKYPANVSHGDYVYRSQIPLIASAVGSWNTYNGLLSSLNNLNQQLTVTPRLIQLPFNGGRIVNPGYLVLQRQITTLQPQVNAASAAIDSTPDRFQSLINAPSRVRCENHEDDVCLTNAELQAIRAKM